MDDAAYTAALNRVLDGNHLDRRSSHDLIGAIMDGRVSAARVGAMLAALRAKGETVDELVGAATAMRERAQRVETPVDGLVDTCGTGGDGTGSFNISTAAAIVAAAAGARVAKHGNRSVSSRCGSADLLEAVGVSIELAPPAVADCIADASIGFMFAPLFHPAMANVGPVRRELGVRTVFNLLGPLTNPAGARRQVIGVYARGVAPLMAESLAALGCDHALVVHGAGGMDELALHGDNQVFEIRQGAVREFVLRAPDVGVDGADELPAGGDATANVALLDGLLAGERGALHDSVALNAGAALYVAGISDSIADGVKRASETMVAGRARQTLDTWRQTSQTLWARQRDQGDA